MPTTPTRRTTIPAAEEILGGYFPVLDHGFVALIDYMGSDESIEQAARVSYGYGTRSRSLTRGLIRYLRRHRHTTPSEMVELKFHCAMPMFVARQWIRHRTACLAGDTEVYFDLPSGIERRGNQLYKVTIEDLWKRFQPTRNRTRSDKQRNQFHRRDRVRSMHLRQVNEATRRIQHTRILNVLRNGKKPVFRVVLADGKTIKATADHRFIFADGWGSLKEKTGLEERGGRAVWRGGEYFLHVNGLVCEQPALYTDRAWLDHEYNALNRRVADIADDCDCSPHTIRKWLRKHGIQATDGRGAFGPGHVPWNKGKDYILGPRELSAEWLEANRRARSGEASNFWRGGLTGERSELHCHHIVPVWAEPSLARERSNLTTLCGACHRRIQGRELEYVATLGGPAVKTEWQEKKRPRRAWNSLTMTRLVRIARFEYVGLEETYDLEVEGPYHNFIANGIVTHNSVNEYSGRYSLMPLLFYRPEYEQFALQSASNRQGREEGGVPRALYEKAVQAWERARAEAGETYGWLVGEDVARELARIDLPLSTYTQWYWKIDLHNLLHFLSLRADPHAQWEIRAYAEVMAGMLQRVAPLSYEAWIDYEVCGAHLSRGEMEALRRLVAASDDGLIARPEARGVTASELAELGLSRREIRELADKLQPAARPDYALDLASMRTPEEFEARLREAVPGDFE
ncbi:MAG: FAD-dependent thymidylate synthase [Gemmatimonadota bacterium]